MLAAWCGAAPTRPVARVSCLLRRPCSSASHSGLMPPAPEKAPLTVPAMAPMASAARPKRAAQVTACCTSPPASENIASATGNGLAGVDRQRAKPTVAAPAHLGAEAVEVAGVGGELPGLPDQVGHLGAR